ncbi:FAS1 domain-containing protein [Pseudomassariella vexata]|uniref:FAS1 domain-containing protein n=1 Tax=Pseudomassariella vexata TaxID=1141098 RepID=A0A1Y2EFK9_9PEZI|nr:FAS1 domain-containing protein [Pseudomassariella vexata]ORY70339.1 FAS1 domain-containing protein [Pseudomassariella vexata]
MSGLGGSVSLLQTDIPYDGGLIQVTDGYFTLPQSLSQTILQKQLTTFLDLINKFNLTATWENTPFVTIFVPTNDAFNSSKLTGSEPGFKEFLLSHIVVDKDMVGYLPNLHNGQTLETKSHLRQKVEIRGSDYFIGDLGAKIVRSQMNIGLTNGVAHVVDKVLTMPTATVTTAAASDLSTAAGATVAVILAALAGLLLSSNF